MFAYLQELLFLILHHFSHESQLCKKNFTFSNTVPPPNHQGLGSSRGIYSAGTVPIHWIGKNQNSWYERKLSNKVKAFTGRAIREGVEGRTTRPRSNGDHLAEGRSLSELGTYHSKRSPPDRAQDGICCYPGVRLPGVPYSYTSTEHQ